MNKSGLHLICIALFLTACSNPVQPVQRSDEQIKTENTDKELVQLGQMQKDIDAGRNHIKKNNPDSLIIIEGYKLRKGQYYNTLSVNVHNKSSNDIDFLQLSWQTFDVDGRALSISGNEKGSSSEVIPQGTVKTLEYQIEGKLPKFVMFRLDTVRMGDVIWDYDHTPLILKK